MATMIGKMTDVQYKYLVKQMTERLSDQYHVNARFFGKRADVQIKLEDDPVLLSKGYYDPWASNQFSSESRHESLYIQQVGRALRPKYKGVIVTDYAEGLDYSTQSTKTKEETMKQINVEDVLSIIAEQKKLNPKGTEAYYAYDGLEGRIKDLADPKDHIEYDKQFGLYVGTDDNYTHDLAKARRIKNRPSNVFEVIAVKDATKISTHLLNRKHEAKNTKIIVELNDLKFGNHFSQYAISRMDRIITMIKKR